MSGNGRQLTESPGDTHARCVWCQFWLPTRYLKAWDMHMECKSVSACARRVSHREVVKRKADPERQKA